RPTGHEPPVATVGQLAHEAAVSLQLALGALGTVDAPDGDGARVGKPGHVLAVGAELGAVEDLRTSAKRHLPPRLEVADDDLALRGDVHDALAGGVEARGLDAANVGGPQDDLGAFRRDR